MKAAERLAVVLETAPVPTLFFALGERGKRAERVADEAVEQAVAHLEAEPAGVDIHSADQLVLPLALASGPSSFPVAAVTQHLITNVAVIRFFLERDVQLEGAEGSPGSNLNAAPLKSPRSGAGGGSHPNGRAGCRQEPSRSGGPRS